MTLKHFFIILFLVSFTLYSQSKDRIKVAITIDDLPFSTYKTLKVDEKNFIYDKIINTFEREKIQALLFLIGNTYKTTDDQYLTRIISKGHLLGNHTFSHLNLNSVSLEQYTKDILKCEKLVSKFSNNKKYFRFPYLTEGNSKEKVDGIYSFFSENNYTPVPVSLFCTDSNFASAFEKAFTAKNTSEMDKIAKEYLSDFRKNAKNMIDFAKKHTRKNPGHILLFHMSLLSAYTIDDLIKICKEFNMDFVTIENILQEDLYKKTPKYYGGAGYTWFERF